MNAIRARLKAVAIILLFAGFVGADAQVAASILDSQAKPIAVAEWSATAGPRGSLVVYVRPTTSGLPDQTFEVAPVLPAIVLMLVLVAAFVDVRHLERPRLTAGLGLVIGGSASNAIDLLQRGTPVDYIAFALDGRLVAVVNIADLAVAVGAVTLVLALAPDLVRAAAYLPNAAVTVIRSAWH